MSFEGFQSKEFLSLDSGKRVDQRPFGHQRRLILRRVNESGDDKSQRVEKAFIESGERPDILLWSTKPCCCCHSSTDQTDAASIIDPCLSPLRPSLCGGGASDCRRMRLLLLRSSHRSSSVVFRFECRVFIGWVKLMEQMALHQFVQQTLQPQQQPKQRKFQFTQISNIFTQRYKAINQTQRNRGLCIKHASFSPSLSSLPLSLLNSSFASFHFLSSTSGVALLFTCTWINGTPGWLNRISWCT